VDRDRSRACKKELFLARVKLRAARFHPLLQAFVARAAERREELEIPW
jgi:hypothetical protein